MGLQAAILAAARNADRLPVGRGTADKPAVPPGQAAGAETGLVFTLIKGPPGTGKTTTLKGLLNLLHAREYSRFYEQVAPVCAFSTRYLPFSF